MYNPALGLNAQSREKAGAIADVVAAWRVSKGDPLIAGGRDFVRQSTAQGNRAEVWVAEGQKHGFFNDRPRGAGPWHALTLANTDEFLASLGYLSGKPTVRAPEGTTAALAAGLGAVTRGARTPACAGA
jgi:hypothetical protein